MIWVEWIGTGMSILGVALMLWGGARFLLAGFAVLSAANFVWAAVAIASQLAGLLALQAILLAFNLFGIYRLRRPERRV